MKDCRNVFATHSLITIYDWPHIFYSTKNVIYAELKLWRFFIDWVGDYKWRIHELVFVMKIGWHEHNLPGVNWGMLVILLLLIPYFSNTSSKLRYEENARFFFS